MKWSNIHHLLRHSFLMLGITGLIMPNAFAQSAEEEEQNDRYRIIKPGSAVGWYDFREDVTIPSGALLTEYKWLFNLGNEDDMRLHSQKSDKLGFLHSKYYQYYRNYRIWGNDVIVHEKNGKTQSVNGRVTAGMNRNTTPVITEEQARAVAFASKGNVTFLWEVEEAEQRLRENENNPAATWYPAGELVWTHAAGLDEPVAGDFRLCWKFDVRVTGASGVSERIFVDAESGEIIRTLPLSIFCDAGTGTTTWYGTQDISTKQQVFSSNFELHDDCTSSHDYKIHTKDMNNGNGTTEYEDGDNSWTGTADQDGVTTHWCAHRSLDYYTTVHGRNSYNDNGANVDAFNNGLGSFASNACWGCDGNVMTFGEGPTTSASDDWNSMEVVGHEFTHGVTQTTADLEYEKQSGALNESFSDIFGTVIENWTGAGVFDWTIGEEFGAPIRNMLNPNANNDPDTYQGTNWFTLSGCTPTQGNDNCGVHTNSGVQNFAFYLMSVGGSGTNDNGTAYSVSGIGIDDAADIAYRALTVYLTSTSKHLDARESWIRAANDLFGSCSDEALAVGNAWFAVGVGPAAGYYDNSVCGDIIAVLGDIKYNGINSVIAASGCTTTILPGTFDVTFEASNVINLDDGFTAVEGTSFYAVIDPCNISYYERTAGESKPDVYESQENPTSATGLQLGVFPSPFTASFEVRLTFRGDPLAELSLCDVTGKVLKEVLPQRRIHDESLTLTVRTEELASGIYFLRGSVGDDVINRKMLKMQ